MKKQNIIGYLVLDEDGPARAYPYGRAADRYVTYKNSHRAVSLFPDANTARRVKHLLYRRYSGYANNFGQEPDDRERAQRWINKARSLRITAVINDAPAAEDLRTMPGDFK